MNSFSFCSVFIAVLLLSGCGDPSANAGSTPGNNAGDASAIELQQREVTFSVPDMSCPMCPITVRKSLAGVDGVSEARASLDDKQAWVVFDPARTSTGALIAAVADAGFTATPHGEARE